MNGFAAKARETWVKTLRLEEAEALVDEWKALSVDAAEPNVFFEPWFLLPALRHLDPRRRVRVLVVLAKEAGESRPQLVGLFPIQITARLGVVPIRMVRVWAHRYCFLATPLVHRDRVDVVATAIVDWHLAAFDRRSVFRLAPIGGDGLVAGAFARAASRQAGLQPSVRAHRRAVIKPGEDAVTYLSRAVSPARQKEYRRLERRLADGGRLAYRSGAPDGAHESWVEQFLALEARGWKGRRGSAMASRPDSRAFFVEMAAGARAAGRLRWLALEIDGQPIAMKCSLDSGSVSFAFKIAYDESHAARSPGVLLELENIRRLHDAPGVTWMDSCAIPSHPMIDRLWTERREIAAMTIGSDRFPARLVMTWLKWYERRGPSEDR